MVEVGEVVSNEVCSSSGKQHTWGLCDGLLGCWECGVVVKVKEEINKDGYNTLVRVDGNARTWKEKKITLFLL
jgi:hypothetical protein